MHPHNYFADVIWQIDKGLLLFSVLLVIFSILYVAIKEALEYRGLRKLAIIKNNLQGLARSGQKTVENVCPAIIGKVSSQQFMEIIRNREAILPEGFSRELRDCFAASGKISEIEKIAQKSRNKWRRIQAIIALGYSDSPAAVEIIERTLTDRDLDISYFSMLALGQIRNERSARILLNFIGHNPANGNRIATMLEQFPPSIAGEVAQATYSTVPAVRFWALKLLSRFQAKTHLKRIEELTADKSSDVRAAACDCLGKLGAREAKDSLKHCLRDNAWFVRRHAVKALSRSLGPESIPDVIGLLQDEDWMVKDGVKKALIHNMEAALPYIEKIFEQNDKELKKHCVEALEDSGYLSTLFKHLLSADPKTKAHAAHLLKGIIGSGTHLGLESTIASFDEGTRKSALQIIASIDKGVAEHIDMKIKRLVVEV